MIVATGEYLPPWTLRERAVEAAGAAKPIRAWAYRKKWTTLQTKAGKESWRLKKQWTTDEDLGAFIEALARNGHRSPMPGSYAFAWTERHRPPPTNPTLWVALQTGGVRTSRPRPWMEAVKKGTLPGTWRVYDLNSAYAWAASQPLPDPRAAVYTRAVTRRPFGVYLLRSAQLRAPMIPRRFRQEAFRGRHWVTKEELEIYDAHAVDVEIGIEWEQQDHAAWILLQEIGERYPADIAKRIYRSFWGGWACNRPVDQFSLGRGEAKVLRPLPARQFCPVWAWHVLSRVAARCADVAGAGLAHVFTDSIMVPGERETGTKLGDWKLVETIDNPWIGTSGVWGESPTKLRKHAGRKATTPAATNEFFPGPQPTDRGSESVSLSQGLPQVFTPD